MNMISSHTGVKLWSSLRIYFEYFEIFVVFVVSFQYRDWPRTYQNHKSKVKKQNQNDETQKQGLTKTKFKGKSTENIQNS